MSGIASYTLKQRDNDCDRKISLLQQEVQKLRTDFYNFISPGFIGNFSTVGINNEVTIPCTTHKIKNITSVFFYNNLYERISVYYRIINDNDIYIQSNLPIINYKIVIN
jgi:hypothetical protein